MEEKLILITNDDGIDSDGIRRLARAAQEIGQVWVVAPDGERSAASHSISLHSSMEAYPKEFPVKGVRAYACTGTPGDCIRIGCLNLLPRKPDLVLSGINRGYNCAQDIQYSATAGAAFEGAFQGVISIAFSEGFNGCHEVTDAYLAGILKELSDKPLGFGQIWNVNFPECPISELKGILRDRKVSHGTFYHDHYLETPLENGRIRFMVEGQYNEEAEPGTDFRAVVDGYISIGVAQNIS